MVGWDKICKPKSYGGLGLKNFEAMNEALLTKFVLGFDERE